MSKPRASYRTIKQTAAFKDWRRRGFTVQQSFKYAKADLEYEEAKRKMISKLNRRDAMLKRIAKSKTKTRFSRKRLSNLVKRRRSRPISRKKESQLMRFLGL